MMIPPSSHAVLATSRDSAAELAGFRCPLAADPAGAHRRHLPGTSCSIERLRQQVDRLGPHFRRVLICGEPGSDRERVARALRHASAGRGGPFIKVAHGDLEENASLWKQDPRVARMNLRRLVSSAYGGMIWIDDISSLSIAAQRLLLRLTEERSGDGDRIRIAVGTTAHLKNLVATGLFSHELRLTLASVELQVPPLRDRIEDLTVLAEEIIQLIGREYALAISDVEISFLEELRERVWTGNETELENTLRMAVLSCCDGHLRAEHLPALEGGGPPATLPNNVPDRLQDVIDQHLLRVLASCDGNKLRAADRLGISRSTLYRMLEACAAPERAA